MSRRSLYMIFKDSNKRKVDLKLLDMEQKLMEITKCPENKFQTLSNDLKHFRSDLKHRWTLANYTESRFLTKNKKWLDTSIIMHSWSTMSTSKQGRPNKLFQDLTDRSKRRKTKDLREQVPVEELTYAARVSQRKSGNLEASKIIKDVTATPTRASKFKKALVGAQKMSIKKHSALEALSLFIECDLTKRQYEILHESNKNIYPCYSLIKEEKKNCYPREESMRVTETCAEVHLQDLLNHTASRLCKYLEDVFETCTPEELKNMELITKWGCDGSQQTQFQQKFADSSEDDSNIFQSSLVPVRLDSNIGHQKKILWQNPTPSSPRFCRPIRIRFLHETADITKNEIKYIEDQIKQLTKTELRNSNGVIYVLHTLVPTMVDAKVCNAATNTTSTMRCYICGKTSKDFNDFKATKTENPEALRFGLSTLHARIRLFETLLHIAYKLPLKKWQARGQIEKNIVKQTKKRIQIDFKEKIGLIVDVPKAGFGNSNSGNTSRRFFSDPETAAEITGIDVGLIKKLKIILEAICSGYEIDETKFAKFANETAELYVKLYGWHPMTPTLHKILVHGTTIIKHALLPIGQLSEEAAEARNKHFRSYRLDFTRKFSRVLCNKDVFNRLLLTSDPFLSCKRKRQKLKTSKPFLPETIAMFVQVGPESVQELNVESCG